MRTERNKDGTWNVWMSRDEYREVPRHARSGLAEVAIRLMWDCGLRVAEVLDVRPCDSSRRSDGRHYKLGVVGAHAHPLAGVRRRRTGPTADRYRS